MKIAVITFMFLFASVSASHAEPWPHWAKDIFSTGQGN